MRTIVIQVVLCRNVCTCMYMHIYSMYMYIHTVHLFLLLDLLRRSVDVPEKKYLMSRGVVTETQSNMGQTYVRVLIS